MSFSEPNVYGEVSQGIIAKSNFMESEPKQCAILLNQEDVGNSLVANEEIIVDTNGYLPNKIDCQTESTMYFEKGLENSSDMAARFEESVDTLPEGITVSEGSSIEKWDCENIVVSDLKVCL